MEPLEVIVENPDLIEKRPPLATSVVSPAQHTTPPPFAELPVPTVTVIDPLFPRVASPVATETLPVLPLLDEPVENTSAPDTPFIPAFADPTDRFPLEELTLWPLHTVIDPPVF
jgi:hypothetical protein